MNRPNRLGGGPPLYDVALVKLKSPLQFSDNIRPICLPATISEMYGKQWAKVIGWGTTDGTYKYIVMSLKKSAEN